ncbi:MAG: MBL fold metallo-hydrolase, partial [bacterium]|nr:MBL fold metallo-hydrolase [bacterium]
MLIIKIVATVVFIAVLLLIKSIVKLFVNKNIVKREIDDVRVTRVTQPGCVKELTVLPLIDFYAVNDTFCTEAGVSYYIKADETDILLDVGANEGKKHPSALINNMSKAGKKVDELDFIYLSHIHMDHVGGMKDQKNKTFSLSAG